MNFFLTFQIVGQGRASCMAILLSLFRCYHFFVQIDQWFIETYFVTLGLNSITKWLV